MNKYRLFLLISILPFLFCSCEDEEIDFEVDRIPPMLVVDGTFTNEYKRHQVTLSTTGDYFSNVQTSQVSNAMVEINSELGSIVLEESEDVPGLYETVDPVSGQYGISYTLNIQLPYELNGSSTYSCTQQLIKGIDLDSIEAWIYSNPFYIEGSGMDSLILILISYGYDPNLDNTNHYALDIYQNSVPLYDSVDEVITTSDDAEFSDEYVNSVYFMEEFAVGDTVTLEMASVADGYDDFVNAMDMVINQSGNPFDLTGPPANPVGNITGGEALGYWRVSYVSRASTIADYFELKHGMVFPNEFFGTLHK